MKAEVQQILSRTETGRHIVRLNEYFPLDQTIIATPDAILIHRGDKIDKVLSTVGAEDPMRVRELQGLITMLVGAAEFLHRRSLHLARYVELRKYREKLLSDEAEALKGQIHDLHERLGDFPPDPWPEI